MTIFDHTQQIIIKVNFSFTEFVAACKKSVNFINSFLSIEVKPVLEFLNKYDHAHF